MNGPVERKVTAGGGAAAASGLLLWVLGKYVFKGDVPDVFVSWVYIAVPGILAFAAGYLTRHTHREDLQVPQTPEPSAIQVSSITTEPGKI